MPNIVKYNLSTSPNSIQSGNFNIGVNNTPTNLSQFYTGICPIIGGYTIYINKASNGPSIYAPKNDTQLIEITNNLGGNVTTATEALVWINSQSTMTVLNNNYPSIVTDGLVQNWDAGFVSSYPKTGTTWKNLSGSGINATLINSVGYNNENFGCLVFDGVDDGATLGSTITLGNGSWTVGMWVSANSFLNSYGNLLSNNSGGPVTNAFGLTNGKISYQSYLSNWSEQLGNTNLSTGNWYYLVWVNNSNTMIMYVNGVADSSSFASTTSNGGPINSIGRNWFGSFNGKIATTSIYQKSLTQQEVLQNYYAGLQRLIPTNGLVLSLDAQNINLYATSPTTTYDVSGNNYNGILTNGVQYVSDGNGSWSFDGVDDYISINNPLNQSNLSQVWSVSSWVKQNSGTSGPQYIVNGLNNGLASDWYGNGPLLYLNSGANDYYTYTSTYQSIGGTGWHHLVFLFNNSNGLRQIYKDGVLAGSGVGPNNTSTPSGQSATWYLGQMSGSISTVDIYNRVLTSTEISTIYNATKSRYGL